MVRFRCRRETVGNLHGVLQDLARGNTAFLQARAQRFPFKQLGNQEVDSVLRAHVIYFHAHRDEEAVGLRELAVLREQRPKFFKRLQKIRKSQ